MSEFKVISLGHPQEHSPEAIPDQAAGRSGTEKGVHHAESGSTPEAIIARKKNDEPDAKRRLIMVWIILSLPLIILAYRLQQIIPTNVYKGTIDGQAFMATARILLDQTSKGMAHLIYEQNHIISVQRQMIDNLVGHMPWTYPPATSFLVAAGMAPLSLIGYESYNIILWTLIMMALLYDTARRIDDPKMRFQITVALMAPAMLNMITLQASIIFGYAFFRLALTGHPMWLATGLLKPHLAIGYAPWLFMGTDRRTTTVRATSIILFLTLLTTFVDGKMIEGFLSASRESMQLLMDGRFPVNRMGSFYGWITSTARYIAPGTFDTSIKSWTPLFLGIHLTLGLATMIGVSILIGRNPGPEGITALATSGLLISPYLYDYDLVVVSFILAGLAIKSKKDLSGPLALATTGGFAMMLFVQIPSLIALKVAFPHWIIVVAIALVLAAREHDAQRRHPITPS